MKMKVMSCISICTIINLIRMECSHNSSCYSCNILKICSSFFCCKFIHISHMLLMSNNTSSRMTLLLKKIYFRCLKFTNLNTKLIYKFTFYTICTIIIYHSLICPPVNFRRTLLSIYTSLA